MVRAKIDESMRRELAQRYLADDRNTVPVLAKETGISESAIYRALHKSGVRPMQLMRTGDRENAYRKLSAAGEKKVCSLYQAGHSSNMLAQRFDCNAATILNILQRHKVARRNPGNSQKRRFTDKQLQDIANEWLSGESQHSIARSQGVGQNVISRELARAGYSKETRHAHRERHGMWKGGRVKSGGYVRIMLPDDSPFISMADKGGYAAEHRIVMARHLGRPLGKHETVHHKNGNREDNRLMNLQVRAGKHGRGSSMVCLDCGSHNIKHDNL